MDMEFLKLFAGQGAFAVLFVWLFIDTRKENKLREKELKETIGKNQDIIQENQKIIGKLSENFSVVESIKDDIEDIKEILK